MKRTALALTIILILSLPSMTYAQITRSYSNDSDINPAAFDLAIYSPNDQTVYSDTMLLKFNITWTAFVSFPFTAAPPLKGDYSYSIDDGPLVTIEPNQSSTDELYVHPKGNFTINPSFSYSVNVSSLAKGSHKIVIIVGLYRHSDYYYINQSSIPTLFLVQNIAPTPSPSPIPTSEVPSPKPEDSEPPPTIMVTTSITSVVIVSIGLLVYFKKRNNKPDTSIPS